MKPKVQRGCVFFGLFGFGLLFVGFIVASWFPFPSPSHDAAYIGRFYRQHTDAIRVCCVLVAAGAAFTAPLAAAIAVQIKRIEGEFSPLAYTELAMGCVSGLAISIPAFFWQTAAFRPDRNPVVTQSWHDAGWLCFVATVFIGMVQIGATGVAILSDDAPDPLFPRWLGYLSLWVALLLVPSVLCLWFKHGPFAWDGLLTIYLAFVAAGVWFVAISVNVLRLIRESEPDRTPEISS